MYLPSSVEITVIKRTYVRNNAMCEKQPDFDFNVRSAKDTRLSSSQENQNNNMASQENSPKYEE